MLYNSLRYVNKECAMANREDLRIIKTKAALLDAFFALLDKNNLEDITVNDLCEKAGVRRATFYKHFSDKTDFLTFLIRDIRNRFDAESWDIDTNHTITKEYYTKYTSAVIAFLLTHEDAIRKIMNSQMRASFIDIFMQQNYIDTKERLEASVRSGIVLPTSVEFMSSILIGGISNSVIRWFESEERVPTDVLQAEISRFLDYVLKQRVL